MALPGARSSYSLWATRAGIAVVMAISVRAHGAGVGDAGSAIVGGPTAILAPSPPATKGLLCDDKWIGHFDTIEIGDWNFDGRAIRDYDPTKSEEPWFIRSERYLFRHRQKNMMYKLLGRFSDKAEADKFRNLVVAEQRFWRHFDPNYRPITTSPGAYLVNDSFTCKLERRNDTIDQSNWIIELDGHLFVGRESRCERGKLRKTVTVVDCTGEKDLVKDTFEAPCNVGPVSSCLVRMAPGMFGVQQDYSGSSEGRHLSFKVFDLAKRKKVFGMAQVYDRSVGRDEWVRVKDVDGDSVPELVTEVCEGDSCDRKLVKKWNGRAFAATPAKE